MGWVGILHKVVLGRISWGYCGVRLGGGGWVEYCWVGGIVYFIVGSDMRWVLVGLGWGRVQGQND